MATHGTTGDTSPTMRRSRRPPPKPRRDLPLAMFDLPSDPMEIVVSAPSGRLGPERWNGDNAEASVATYESAEIVPQQQSARYPSGRSLSPDGVRAGRLLVPLPRASTCRIAGGTELVGQRAALSQVVQPGVCRPPRRPR